MRDLRIWFLCMLGLGFFNIANAHINTEAKTPATNNNNSNTVNYRMDCDQATERIDMAVNNVRARLLTGGDVWWDPGAGDGRYVVPKVSAGQPEVSSIFSGAVWLGGIDPAGNLKVAAQTYGSSSGTADFWPGPLDPTTGDTEQETCAKWDKFFVVTGEEIDEHLRNFEKAEKEGVEYKETDIPKNIKGWPARGNQFFFDIHQFELPNTSQGLGAFWDQDADGFYEPNEGDYPVIEVRGCIGKPQYPDEMTFWIYNDAGNIHSESGADPIQMEIQVQAFAYATNDEINNMTFQRYKLINRAIESIDSTYFAMFVDADLGCYTDDYIGCDTLRSLAFVYNADAADGQTGCTCPQGVNTYCDEIPILGIDYFRGPLDENGGELGMSSFTYFNNPSSATPPPAGTTDPGTSVEFYNYLSGSWRTGEPFEEGGDAYQEGTVNIDYAFIAPPDNPDGWSMCTAAADNSPDFDRRTVQASGPFRLDPGAVNELIVGVVWVADQDYPCPSIRALQSADDIAQALFDNCFDITDGPDAPDMDIIELDRELILVLTNDTVTSNNAFEAYEEIGLTIPETVEDNTYLFEGYKIFQFSGPDVSLSDVNDPDKVRIIAQVDVKNGVDKLYNWVPVESSLDEVYYTPVLMNDGVQDNGIRHSFQITEDQFASGDRTLINHKRYYFTTLAYAYNNYEGFDPDGAIGQRTPYLEGRKNIGDEINSYYTAIPRPIVDKSLQAAYGDGAIITRLDGLGAGGNFLDMDDVTKAAILDGSFNGEIVYNPGAGPIEVKVVNPLEVKDGEFLLTMIDGDLSDDELAEDARWKLIETSSPDSPIFSETTLAKGNEQVLAEYGFSLTIAQTADVGDNADDANGAIGYRGIYPENSIEWFSATSDEFKIPGQPFFDPFYDFVATSAGQEDEILDQKQALSQMGEGYWVPYTLARWDLPGVLTPSWSNGGGIVRNNNDVQELNNVDIIFTSNKDLWSRCVIVDTYSDELAGTTLLQPLSENPDEPTVKPFDVRQSPSVGKEMGPDGKPLPDGDGYGMGWFPGYAIDVETGERLNVFFGENSIYRPELNDEFGGAPLLPENYATGADMMYNPTDQLLIDPTLTGGVFTINKLHLVNGGQHHIYVSRTAYDECEAIRDRLEPASSALRKVKAMQTITWTSMSMLPPGSNLRMLSYADGLIPSDYTAQLRVDNPYQVEIDEDNSADVDTRTGTGQFNYYPAYRFKLKGLQAVEQTPEEVNAALDLINVVPNPYYGYSSYEISQFSTVVKVTNLPAKATITIYSLDGKFIRQYDRDEVPASPEGNNRGVLNRQIAPDLEWDLKNSKGIPVASGVYLIHVDAGALGQRTLKWFGVARQYDPSGL